MIRGWFCRSNTLFTQGVFTLNPHTVKCGLKLWVDLELSYFYQNVCGFSSLGLGWNNDLCINNAFPSCFSSNMNLTVRECEIWIRFGLCCISLSKKDLSINLTVIPGSCALNLIVGLDLLLGLHVTEGEMQAYNHLLYTTVNMWPDRLNTSCIICWFVFAGGCTGVWHRTGLLGNPSVILYHRGILQLL